MPQGSRFIESRVGLCHLRRTSNASSWADLLVYPIPVELRVVFVLVLLFFPQYEFGDSSDTKQYETAHLSECSRLCTLEEMESWGYLLPGESMTLGSFCKEVGADCCFHAQELLAAVLQTNGYCERRPTRCIARKVRGKEAVLTLIEESPRSREVRRLVEVSGNGTGLLNGMNYGPSVSFFPESCGFVGVERPHEINSIAELSECLQVQQLPAPPERLPMEPGNRYSTWEDLLVNPQGRVSATGLGSAWSADGDERTFVVVGSFFYGICFEVPEVSRKFERTVASLSFVRERADDGSESACVREWCGDMTRAWQWISGPNGGRWCAGSWTLSDSEDSRCPVDGCSSTATDEEGMSGLLEGKYELVSECEDEA